MLGYGGARVPRWQRGLRRGDIEAPDFIGAERRRRHGKIVTWWRGALGPTRKRNGLGVHGGDGGVWRGDKVGDAANAWAQGGSDYAQGRGDAVRRGLRGCRAATGLGWAERERKRWAEQKKTKRGREQA